MADVSRFGTFMTLALSVLALLMPPAAQGANAHGRPAPAAEVAAGWVGFADDGIVNETLIGGAARVYVLPRVALGPEVLYLRGWELHVRVNGTVGIRLGR